MGDYFYRDRVGPGQVLRFFASARNLCDTGGRLTRCRRLFFVFSSRYNVRSGIGTINPTVQFSPTSFRFVPGLPVPRAAIPPAPGDVTVAAFFFCVEPHLEGVRCRPKTRVL